VPVDFGNVVRLLSVTVGKLPGVAGVRQVDQLGTEFLEAELGCKVNQRWKLEILVHCTRTADAMNISFETEYILLFLCTRDPQPRGVGINI